jgi:hypothetical protein
MPAAQNGHQSRGEAILKKFALTTPRQKLEELVKVLQRGAR